MATTVHTCNKPTSIQPHSYPFLCLWSFADMEIDSLGYGAWYKQAWDDLVQKFLVNS